MIFCSIYLFFFLQSYSSIIRLADVYWNNKYSIADLILPGEQWLKKHSGEDRIIFEHEKEVDLSLYRLIKIEICSNKKATVCWEARSINTGGWVSLVDENLPLISDGKFHEYTFEIKYLDKINPIIDKVNKLIIEVSHEAGVDSEVQLKKVEFVRHLPSELGKFMINGVCMVSIPEKVWIFNTKIQKGDRLILHTGVYEPMMGALLQKQNNLGWDDSKVEFLVDVLSHDGKENIYQYLMSPLMEEDRGWRFVELDLSKFVENEVQIIFTVRNTTNVSNEYGLWGNPIIIHNDSDEAKKYTPVFIISCDTMRADHLLPYGYNLPTSPNLDKFAKESVLFERAYTTRTFTPVAHMSLLTGLFPKNHGVNAELPAYDHVKLLGEYLKDLGYYSLGYVGATTWFLPSRGYTRGMDEFYYPPEYLRDVFSTHQMLEDRISQLKYDNILVFLHNYDIHTKMFPPSIIYSSDDARFFYFSDMLEPPEPLTPNCILNPRNFFNHLQATLGRLDFFENLYINALYDDCVAKVDYALEEFFTFLKRRGLYDRSIIIIISDHGEALGEHGRYEHVDVYEHTVRIPMMVKFPNNMYAGRCVESIVSLEDVVPTILDYLNIDHVNLDGISLIEIIEGRNTTPRNIFVQNQFQNEEALISEKYKIICSFRESKLSFFNLEQDPMETINLVDKENILVKQFLSEMDSHRFYNGEGWIITIQGKKTWTHDEIIICPRTNLVSVIPESIMFWYKKAENINCLYGTISYPQIEDTYSLYIYPKDIKQELRIGFRSSEKFIVSSVNGNSEQLNEYEFVLDEKYLYWENIPDLPKDGNTYIFVRKKPVVPEREQKKVDLPEEAIENIKNTGYL